MDVLSYIGPTPSFMLKPNVPFVTLRPMKLPTIGEYRRVYIDVTRGYIHGIHGVHCMKVTQSAADGSQALLGSEHLLTVSGVQFPLPSLTGMLSALIYKTSGASGQTQPREITVDNT